MSAMDEQVGGTHYKDGGVQPFELSHANDHDGAIHAIQKYLTRFRLKAGAVDLRKAQHICAIRVAQIEKWGVLEPRTRGINIEDYIESWGMTATQSAIVRMVESWHMVTDMDHEKTCQIIQKRIGELIAEEYPEEDSA